MVNTVHIPKKFVKLQSDTEMEKKTVADITNKLEIATPYQLSSEHKMEK